MSSAMAAGNEISRISVPLAAGVLAAAVLFSRMDNVSGWRYIDTAVIQALLCLSVAPALADGGRLRSSLPFWYVIFFLCGLLRFCTSDLILYSTASGDGTDGELFRPAYEAVRTLIEEMPFADSGNNALAKALILGDRSSLPKEVISAFRNAGAAHLLALSGMHLGVLYLIANRILSLAGNTPVLRKIRNVTVIALTGAYTLLCGSGPSLVRAWLFIALNESGKLLGRPQPPQQTYCAALTLHLLIRPGSIMETGFQLSYLAMAGIVFIWPLVKDWIEEDGAISRIWKAATLSISCQLFTAPLSYFIFGTFPRYFLITNLFAAPLMTVVMCCGVAATALWSIGVEWEWFYLCCEMPFTLLRNLLGVIAGMQLA